MTNASLRIAFAASVLLAALPSAATSDWVYGDDWLSPGCAAPGDSTTSAGVRGRAWAMFDFHRVRH